MKTTTITPLSRLARWMTDRQRRALQQFSRGEEGSWFIALAERIADRINTMPGTYDQDGLGAQAVAYLHYFTPSADFWILEKDTGAAGDTPAEYQCQAFGMVALFGSEPELGYISLPEILSAGAELDLYFEPTTVGALRGRYALLAS